LRNSSPGCAKLISAYKNRCRPFSDDNSTANPDIVIILRHLLAAKQKRIYKYPSGVLLVLSDYGSVDFNGLQLDNGFIQDGLGLKANFSALALNALVLVVLA